jgi:uncharacterized protein (TIGR03083 family)
MGIPVDAAELPTTPPGLAAEVALAQRRALIGQLERLGPDQWSVVTECRPWTVHDVAAHVAGELVYTRNPFAYVGLVGTWRRHYRGLSFLDGTNAAAVRARRDWTAAQLLDALRRDAPTAVPPGWARRIPLAGVAGLPRSATFGYLTDVVLPRDCFMHRHDIARATGRPVEPEPSDAEVVAQVVRDLGRSWTGPNLVLRLSGPGGGAWRMAASARLDDPTLAAEFDAAEFLRHLSGRAVDPSLFEHVPEACRTPLADARVTF